MKRLNNLLFLLVAWVLLLVGVSCSNQEESVWRRSESTVIKAVPQEFKVDGVASTVPGDGEVEHVQACLFENGRLTQVYTDLKASSDGYALKMERLAGTLYVLANLQGLDLVGLRDAGTSESEWLAMQVMAEDGQVQHFFTGTLKLDEQPKGQAVLPITMTRGIVRFDLKIRGTEMTVEKVTLKNISPRGYLFSQTDMSVLSKDAAADYTYLFTSPLQTDSLGFAYVYEQASPELAVCVEGTVAGRNYTVEKSLPELLKRNSVYGLIVARDETTQDVMLDVQAWADGGESCLQPDWDSHIVIDREESELPAGASLNEDGDELFLSCVAADFVLAVDCDDELELALKPGLPLTVEPATDAGGRAIRNHFRVRKGLLPPNYPEEKTIVQFRRKGLQEVYEADCLTLTVQPNPIRLEGDWLFGREDYTCDFARYVDNELGRFVLPDGFELTARFDNGEDTWLKVELAEGQSNTYRVIGGWRPNDPKADGREQSATLAVCRLADGVETEAYTVKRRNFGLPVMFMNGVWWCKYNARGCARNFEEQILVPDDPAVRVQKTLFEYLSECTPEEYMALWNHSAYIGDSGIALEAVAEGGLVKLKGYQVPSVNLGLQEPKSLAPDGYEMPTVEHYDRIFNNSLYMRFDASGGPYTVYAPWNGKRQVFTLSGSRSDLQVGDVTLPVIYLAEVYNKLNGVKDEVVTFYGPGAQWNNNGINHNKLVMACYSPDEIGWFNRFSNNTGLWRQRNGKENTAIVRFIKSPVEYMY